MRQIVSVLSNLFGGVSRRPPPSDQQAFARKEAELRERLERLAREVEVIQRDESRDEPS